MQKFLTGLLVGLLALHLAATPADRLGASIFVQASEPPAADVSRGTLWFDTTAGSLKFVLTTGPVTWGEIPSSASGLPAGAIALIVAGSCPAGYAEESSLDGQTLVGTLAANGNIGTTGGSDTLTPAGTNTAPGLTMNSYTPAGSVAAPVFTGNALGTHAHELPWQIPSTTTIRQIAVATFGTGTSRAATAVSAAGTSNTTSAAVALSQAVSAGTPAGTNSAPAFTGTPATLTGSVAAPVFTGTSADNRSAFTRVIFCKKT